jgi:hypothetical protein
VQIENLNSSGVSHFSQQTAVDFPIGICLSVHQVVCPHQLVVLSEYQYLLGGNVVYSNYFFKHHRAGAIDRLIGRSHHVHKLLGGAELLLDKYNWVNAHTPAQIANALKLQSLCYYEVRARFGLSSNLAQQVCRRVAGSRKVAQQKNRPVKEFKKPFVTYDSARIFSFREKDWTVSITTVDGRERFELAIGNYQRVS